MYPLRGSFLRCVNGWLWQAFIAPESGCALGYFQRAARKSSVPKWLRCGSGDQCQSNSFGIACRRSTCQDGACGQTMRHFALVPEALPWLVYRWVSYDPVSIDSPGCRRRSSRWVDVCRCGVVIQNAGEQSITPEQASANASLEGFSLMPRAAEYRVRHTIARIRHGGAELSQAYTDKSCRSDITTIASAV